MAGLYENIHKKRKRIEQGSGEKMRKPGEEGAPSAKDFRDSEKTAKKEEVFCNEEKLLRRYKHNTSKQCEA